MNTRAEKIAENKSQANANHVPQAKEAVPLQKAKPAVPIAQLEQDEGDGSAGQEELLDLAGELEKNNPEIAGLSEGEVEAAIGTIRQGIASDDEKVATAGLKKIKSLADNAKAATEGKGTVQRLSKTVKETLKGALKGLLFLVVGVIPGAVLGYRKGKRLDLADLNAVPGITGPQVTFMMGLESSAYTIRKLIEAEANQNPAAIHQLYQNGFTTAEITDLLALEPNAQTIHQYWITPIPNFTLANITFVSVANGRVGSIYFNGGRVRLLHATAGPAVENHPGGVQSTISHADHDTVYQQGYPVTIANHLAIFNYTTHLNSFQPVVVGQGDVLVEFWGVNGAAGFHFSRGGPRAFNYGLTQNHVNIIGNVVANNPGNNAALRGWTRAIRAIRALPMNNV